MSSLARLPGQNRARRESCAAHPSRPAACRFSISFSSMRWPRLLAQPSLEFRFATRRVHALRHDAHRVQCDAEVRELDLRRARSPCTMSTGRCAGEKPTARDLERVRPGRQASPNENAPSAFVIASRPVPHTRRPRARHRPAVRADDLPAQPTRAAKQLDRRRGIRDGDLRACDRRDEDVAVEEPARGQRYLERPAAVAGEPHPAA